jgi:hypothetical protein
MTNEYSDGKKSRNADGVDESFRSDHMQERVAQVKNIGFLSCL